MKYFCTRQSRALRDFQVAEKVVQHKFPGRGQLSTPCASIGDLVYILSQLPGEVGQKLANLGAATTTGLIGGDMRLVHATLAARAEQERMAAEDPTNPLRLFGEKAEAEGGASIEWRMTRQEPTNRNLAAVENEVGARGMYHMRVQHEMNQGSMGFQEPTTADFKRANDIPLSNPLMDYMTEEQVTARKLLELVNAKKFRSCSNGKEALSAAKETSAAFAPVFRDQKIHISEENPFVKVNRRLLPLEERAADVNKRLKAV